MLFRSHVQVALCVVLSPAVSLAVEERSLVELLEHRVLELKPVGLGGHTGHVVRVTARNLSTGPVLTRIPSGWVFTSKVPEVQDLIVVRDEELAIAGGVSLTVTCRAFCCEASGRGPQAGELYHAGRPAGAKLQALARSVAAGDYPDELVQSAVWVISDGNTIAGMGAMDSTAMDTLRMVVSGSSGQPAPLFTARYGVGNDRACTPRPVSIHRSFRYSTPAGSNFTAVVLDCNGRVLHVFNDHTALDPGAHTFTFDLDVHDWPPGTYAIHVHSTDRAGAHRLPFTL